MNSNSRPKVIHVISNLSTGGAEKTLFAVVTGLPRYHHQVVSLTSLGFHGPLLQENGFQTTKLSMARGKFSTAAFTRLVRILRQEQPDIVFCWMYHSNLLGGVAAKMAGVPRIVWNVRKAHPGHNWSERKTLLVALLGGLLSWRVPDVIISCSKKAAEGHRAFGYNRARFFYIANGVDSEVFAPDSPGRNGRAEVPESANRTSTIGVIARYHRQKDIPGFLESLALLADLRSPPRVILAGEGMDVSNTDLARELATRSLAGAVTLYGHSSRVSEILREMDLLVLPSSYGEGFPNVLLEAMASGVPCIATDVGDSAEILAGHGWVVPPSNPAELSAALRAAITLPLAELRERGARGRSSVLDRFSVAKMLDRYDSILTGLVGIHVSHGGALETCERDGIEK